jgi:rhodanese-related sulfurtransferase/uncharacterized protein (DUF2267 family)
MQVDAMLSEITRRGGPDHQVEALDAAGAVLSVLGERLGRGVTEQLEPYVPSELADALRGESPREAFGLSEFTRRVAARAGCSLEDAAHDITAVLGATVAGLPDRTRALIAHELPSEYAQVLTAEPATPAAAGLRAAHRVGAPRSIGRRDVELLVAQGATLAEVLPRKEYDWAHLAGALSLPLEELTPDLARAQLPRDRPVIVYCHNTECDLSPRAAWFLQDLGYDARDYEAGKMDWISYDLPHAGSATLVADVARRDIGVCGPTALVADQAGLLARQALCPVVNELGVVLGALTAHHVEHHGNALARDVMTVGVKTVRPSEEVDALSERMRHASVHAILVTRSDGSLVGLYERD